MPMNRYVPSELPPGFVPTAEEQALLDLYGTVREYEKEAARLSAKAAQAKLAEADERFRRGAGEDAQSSADAVTGGDGEAVQLAKKKKKKKKQGRRKAERKPEEAGIANDDLDGDGSSSYASEGESASEEEGMEGGDLTKKREEKLQKMRDEIDEKKRKAAGAEEDEEAMRARHLKEGDAADATFVPILKRKKQRPDVGSKEAGPSLIANLEGQATPPSEFSKGLDVGAENQAGSYLFPTDGLLSWTPSPDSQEPTDGDLELRLADFDSSQLQSGLSKNTIAIKFSSPVDSKRFSINIAGPNHRDYYDIYMHFNPRQRQKGGQLVINDKTEGIWGSAIEVPLSQVPLMFGQESNTLIIQITGDGFDLFLDGHHCARLEHRTELPKGKCDLTLQFPSTDDYGNSEEWTVYKVWWGQKPSMAANTDLSGVAGVNMYKQLHPRKLFVSNLPKLHSQPESDLRKAELERAFRKFGGAHGVTVIAPLNSTFAFVEVETERQADLALQEMAAKYRLNRARRNRHEALKEERAAAETAGGKPRESSEWD